MKVAILTASDKGSRGERQDRSALRFSDTEPGRIREKGEK